MGCMGKGKVFPLEFLPPWGYLPTHVCPFPHPFSGRATLGHFSWSDWGCFLYHSCVFNSVLLGQS